MSQINMAQALYSPSYAEKAWINYYYQGNTMGITDAQIGEIAGTWNSQIPTWKHYAESQDFNQYEISDESFDNAVDDGYEYGQDLTDYDNTGWDKTKQVGRTVVDGAGAAVTGAQSLVQGGQAAGNVVGKAANKLIGKTAEKTTEKTTEKVAEKATEKLIPGLGDFILIGACALDLAEAVAYKVAKPNEKQVEAVNVLAEDMGNQQAQTMEAQDQLMTMDSELASASDDAVGVQDMANNEIGESRTMYEFHSQTIEYFEKAKTAGYEFTQDDVKAYQESLQYMAKLSDEVEVTHEDAENAVNEIYDDMAGYQDGFDGAAESIANVQGVTDYAEGFDELTQKNCSAESMVQTVNAGASAVDMGLAAANVLKYAATPWFAALFAAAGVAAGAGGVMDGAAAGEQSKWSDEAGNEVDLRTATQELNADSLQTYEENVDYYDGYMQNVEDLEVIVPDDMEVPDAEVPVVGNSNLNGDNNNNETDGNGGNKKPKN